MAKKEVVEECRDEMVSMKNIQHVHTCSSPKHALGAHFCPGCKEWWGKAKRDGS